MATNRVHKPGEQLAVAVSHPTAPTSGQPCRLGSLTGVAVTDEDTTSGETTVDFGPAVWNLPVKGVNDAGNSAVAVGDDLFYVDADVDDGTGFLSKKTEGRHFGVALAAVNSGSTTTVAVKHVPGLGAGEADLGEVIGTANIEDDAITKAKLAGGFLKVELLAGQDGGSDPTYTTTKGFAVGDEIVFVGHFTTAAAIATLADVTADFTVTGANELTDGGPTDYSNDQLLVIAIDLT